ncbi:MAG: hypothetical protein ACI9TY_000839 [Alphaproteobacteria bacterium]|jgi:hypothetical protein
MQSEELVLHLNVPQHIISTAELLTGVKALDTLVTELNDKIFDGSLPLELQIIPSTDGSFKILFHLGAIL